MKQKSELRLFLSFLEGSRRFFLLGVAAALLMTLCDMLIPQMIRYAVDVLIAGGGSVRPVFFAVAAAALAGAFFRWLSTLMNAKGGETLVKTMQDRLYSHIARLPFSWHMEHAAGDIIQRCTSDVTMIKEFCSEQLYNLVRIVLMIVMALFFMLSMDVKLTMCAFAFVPLIVGYSTVFLIRISSQFQRCDENEGKLSAVTQENLTGVRVVRAFGREAAEEKKFRAQNDVYTNLWMKLCEYLAWFWAFGDLASGLQVMTVVLAGAYFCVRGPLTVGSYIAFISYNNMLVWPIRALGRMISEMSKSGVSLRRIADILSAEPERLEAEKPESGKPEPERLMETETEVTEAQTGETGIRPAAAQDLETPAGETILAAGQHGAASPDIVFDHVSFSFGDRKVLDDVSLTVPAGTTAGILGTTGCGKSTLMYLLLRLYELPEGQGSITLGGRDIREIPLSELRGYIGMVLQEPYLFSRTIGENIRITGRADDEAVARAVRTAALEETIREFPAGFDTMVGERGVTLSGGQKQRIAIARMLTGDQPVMIFDDSLSAVDAATDARIRRNLRQSLGDRTVFLISHRISTLMHADCIYVMSGGRIAEQGTHEELLKKDGLYAEIWRLQSLPEEEAEGGAVHA